MTNMNNYGFKSGRVEFPGLGMIANLSEGRYFRNDGIVSDVNAYADSIERDYGHKNTENYYGRRLAGKCFGITGYDSFLECMTTGAIIFVGKDTGKPIEFLFGHESTHALIMLDLEKEFVDFIHENGFSLNPFNKYNDEEDIADIGGALSLLRAGKQSECKRFPNIYHAMNDLLETGI